MVGSTAALVSGHRSEHCAGPLVEVNAPVGGVLGGVAGAWAGGKAADEINSGAKGGAT